MRGRADKWLRSVIGTVSVALVCALAFARPGLAARKALLIGNAEYANTTPLPNTVNDVRDLNARLREFGYDVTLGVNMSRAQMLTTFQSFVRSLGADDIALLFYAGHAIQLGGENYLFPTDARVEREADVRSALVSLNALLADLARATRRRIVILDACRDNPFAKPIAAATATRSAGSGSGLARVYDGVGSYIAFSTQPGNVALDGSGRNSPFAAALLRHIGQSTSDVHGVMRRVRADVQQATANAQIPWENSSLIDEISFAGGVTQPAITATPSTAAPTDAQASPRASVVAPPPGGAPATKQPAALPAPEPYHFVGGLDPNGDNFLALRAGTASDAPRIATMGPDTLLKVIADSGPWRQVVLRDGMSGWAHSNWIRCCRAESGAAQAPVAPATKSETTCEALWTERNAIWKRYAYCFTTERAQRVFGNSACFRDQPAAMAAMTVEDRTRVGALLAQEKQSQCR